MSIINASYFIGELNIPNTDKVDVLENLQFFIDRYEKEYLRKVLGVDLYNDFIDGIDPIIEPWLSLKNGKDFVNLQGRLTQYFGLANDDKQSPLANYVYYHFQKNAYTQSTGVGETQSKTENATVVSPGAKMEKAWNDMVKQTNVLVEFLYVNNSLYPKFSLAYVSRELLDPINTWNI